MPTRLTLSLLTLLLVFGAADGLGKAPATSLHAYFGLLALAAYIVLLHHLSRAAFRCLIGTLLAISLLVTLLACIQMGFMPRARGPFDSATYLAGYAVLMIFLGAVFIPGARQEAQDLTLIAIGANAISLALSQGRGAFLALGAGLVALLARKRPWLALALCAPLLVGALYFTTERQWEWDDPRFGIWRIAFQAALLRPLLGWGQNALFISGLGRFYSVALTVLVSAGILGLLAFAWAVVEASLAVRCLPAKEKAAGAAFLIAWLVNGLFIFPTVATAIPLATMLAYLLSVAGNPADRAGRIDNHHPLLNGGMRARWPY